MDAKALVTNAHQRFSIESVSLPVPGPRQIKVQTLYSGVSIGTEFAVIKGKLNWGPYPLVTGYQGVGNPMKFHQSVGGALGGLAGRRVGHWATDARVDRLLG